MPGFGGLDVFKCQQSSWRLKPILDAGKYYLFKFTVLSITNISLTNRQAPVEIRVLLRYRAIRQRTKTEAIPPLTHLKLNNSYHMRAVHSMTPSTVTHKPRRI